MLKYRINAFVLLAALAVSFVGCTQDTNDTLTTTGGSVSTDSSGTDAEETTADPLDDGLPEADYGGYKFRILAADNDVDMIYSDELDGSLMNDAVFNANLNVEQRFNVDFERVMLDNYMNGEFITSSIMSGSDDFDLGVCHDYTSASLSLKGLFRNLYELEHIDFSKPWWPEFTTSQLTINNKMYIFSNYIGYNGLRGTKNMYVNLDKLEEYHIDSPYDMVRDGSWTLDRLIEITKDVYADLDGNTEATSEDFYGFAFTGLFYGWLENFGIEAYAHSDDGSRLVLDINNQRTIDLIDKLKAWLNGGNAGVYYRPSHDGLYSPGSYPFMFAEGKCLFTYGSLFVLIENLKDSNVNYGILPMPKYDENQEYYYGVCYDSPMWVPITVTDTDRTGMIIEAMSAEGYKTIMPAYKDIALKNRYAVDTDSAEMLDIIFANRVISVSLIYGNVDGFQGVLNTLIPSDTLEFSSYYAQNEASQQAVLDEINEFYSSGTAVE